MISKRQIMFYDQGAQKGIFGLAIARLFHFLVVKFDKLAAVPLGPIKFGFDALRRLHMDRTKTDGKHDAHAPLRSGFIYAYHNQKGGESKGRKRMNTKIRQMSLLCERRKGYII